MSRINLIPDDFRVETTDRLLGSDTFGSTRNYSIDLLTGYFAENVVTQNTNNVNGDDSIKFWCGTEAEFQAIESPDENTIYFRE